MASIRDLWKDPDREGCPKRWLVRYRDPAGRSRSQAFARKPEAEAFRDQVATDVRRGDYIDPRAGRVLFRQLAEQWRDARTVAATTGEWERITVGKLVRHFGDYPVGEIRPSRIRAWMSARRKTIAVSTLRQEMWVLRSVLEAAVDDDMIRKSPLAKIRRPAKGKARRVEPWSLDTIRAILEAHPEHVAPVGWLGAGAGLRISESFAVGVDDIDFLRRELRVERQVLRVGNRPAFGPPKRGSVGTVPLPAELVDLLSAHVQEHPPVEVTLPWLADGAKDDETRTVRLICVGRRSAALRRDEYNKSFWLPALKTAGVAPAGKATGHHVLRHCYASYLLAEGKPITVVQARLRHSTLEETVRTYAHLVPDAESDRTTNGIASLFHACYTPVPRHRDTTGA